MGSCLLDSSPNHSPAARLAHFMSEISEASYCAEWNAGTGRTLWRMVHEEGPSEWGMGEVWPGDKQVLITMARDAGGWCVFRDGVVLVPWPEWDAICEREGLPLRVEVRRG